MVGIQLSLSKSWSSGLNLSDNSRMSTSSSCRVVPVPNHLNISLSMLVGYVKILQQLFLLLQFS